MRKPRLLIYVQSFLPHTETFIYNQLTYLEKEFDVKILTRCRANEDLFHFKKVMVVPLSFLEVKIFDRLDKKGYDIPDLISRRKIRREVRDFNPDIILSHFSLNASFLSKALNSKQHIHCIFHGYDASTHLQKNKKFTSSLDNLLYRKKIIPLFVSAGLYRIARKHLKNLEAPVILNLGVDTNFFKRIHSTRTSQDVKIFTQISSLSPKKGHLFLLEAFSKLIKMVDKPVILNIIGEGSELLNIQEKIKLLGLSENVNVLEKVDKFGVKSHLQNSDYFIHPSITAEDGNSEGIPTVIMEAMSMELPIVSTFHSGIPELVENKVNGILVVEGKVDELALAMVNILSWEYLTCNREKVCEQFQVEKSTQKLCNYLHQQLS